MLRIDRYVLREVLVPFAYSVVLVVLLVFLLQVERLATAALGLGLSAGDAVVIFGSALPPFLVLALPIAYLLSVLVGLGRLSVDLEIAALRAAGASPLRIARAPILLGVAVTLLCLPVAHFGEPYGLRLLYARLIDVGLRNITEGVEPGVFNEGFEGMTLYARDRASGGKLLDVLLHDERDPSRPALILARNGELKPEGRDAVVLTLTEGEIHLAGKEREDQYDRVGFARARLGIDAGAELVARTRFLGPKERMTSPEMLAQYRALGPDDRYGRNVEKVFWRRFALPSMAFVFGVVGVAIALSGGPRARARSAVLAMLAILGYYCLARIGDYLVNVAPGTSFAAAFGPDLVTLAAGIVGLVRSGRPR